MKRLVITPAFALILFCILCSCGNSLNTIKSTSDRELAELYDAVKGKKVIFFYRDAITDSILKMRASDLLVDTHITSWTDESDALRTIPTSQLLKVVCLECKSNTLPGALIGAASGGAAGFLYGAADEIGPSYGYFNNPGSSSPPPPPKQSKVPIATVVGGILGGAVGGFIAAGSPSHRIWLLDHQR